MATHSHKKGGPGSAGRRKSAKKMARSARRLSRKRGERRGRKSMRELEALLR